MESLYRITHHNQIMSGGSFEYILNINDLPDYAKPREKLKSEGLSSLSLAELLAIVFTTGTRKEDVLTLTSRIFRDYGPVSIKSSKNYRDLVENLHIPEDKALKLVSLVEIGRRLFESSLLESVIIRTPRDVYEYVSDIRSLPKEHLRGIYLDSHHRVIHDEVIAIGTVNSNITHPREVFRPAFIYSAVAVILAHNHPSGIAEPSSADREVTRTLIQTGELIGISLLDHVIVTKDSFVSIINSS